MVYEQSLAADRPLNEVPEMFFLRIGQLLSHASVYVTLINLKHSRHETVKTTTGSHAAYRPGTPQ